MTSEKICPLRSTAQQDVPCHANCAWNISASLDSLPVCAAVSLASLAGNMSTLTAIAGTTVRRPRPQQP